jgi:1,5-anhydro-D-fructose reductase (1,5-anhydro-D-mannitol-forming)
MSRTVPLNLALLGTGGIATRAFAPALASTPNARLWSVLSRSRERAEAFAVRHGARSSTPAYDDLAALVSDPDLDGVIVATPDRLHVDQVTTAARAGKHILCEKPLATSVDEAGRMVEEVESAGVTLAVAYHLRWHAGHRLVAVMAEAGELGELRHMRVQWAWPAPDDSNWRANEEVGRWWSLAGVGTHCLDLIRWLMVPSCGEVVELKSVISRGVWKGPHDETAVVAMRFESGATAEFNSSVLFAAPSRMELYGSKGFAIGTGTLGPHGAGSIETPSGPIAFTPRDPYVSEIDDFVSAIRLGRPPAVDGIEGLRNVELLTEASP